MPKTRILHVITNLALGGAQKNALYVTDHLDGTKYEKHFICAPWGGLAEDTGQYKQIKFYFLPCLKRRISLFQDLKCFFAIKHYIKQHRITIVHTHSSKAGIIGRWAARFAGVSVILHTIHGWSFNDYMPKLLKMFYIFLERVTAKITTCLIAVSNQDIKKGLKYKIGQVNKYKRIYYGIEINKFAQQDYKDKEKNKQIVGMIACLKPQKNPIDFIRAAEIIAKTDKNVQFVCVGDGELRKKLEKEITSRGLNKQIKLLGWRRDISKLIKQMDIVVLTSLWEGLPISLLEAMAASKPIVAYDTDGVCEVVQNGISGFLCSKNDVYALAQKIKKLLDEPVFAENMGQKAYALINDSDFKGKAMMKNIEGLYSDLLNNKEIKV